MTHDVVTFGCRLNSFESQVIKDKLVDCNHERVIVFNTCAVTKEAQRQAKQAIRKKKRLEPDAYIVVTGCAAQITPHEFADMPQVGAVLGNEEKFDGIHYQTLPNFSSDEEKIRVNDIMSIKETAPHFVSTFDGKSRAFVQIQNGCNHRCTFCIIPYGRGNSRSVPMGEIVRQIRHLVLESGYNEIVLTGVDISDYGKDLPGSPTLGQMMKRLLTLVPQLRRLRLSSIDVAEIDDELLELICYEPRVMPHIHISLQAGDDMILKRMKRRHTRDQVITFCDHVRGLRSDVAFGADIIAGFPTENDMMFENTLRLVCEAGLQFLHVFPYSAREGTPAARMPQVPLSVRKERAAVLRIEGEKMLGKYLSKYINSAQQVIVEKGLIGRAENYAEVVLPDNHHQKEGGIVAMKMTDVRNNQWIGEWC